MNAEYADQDTLEQAVSAWGRSRRRFFGIYAWTLWGLATTALLTTAILSFTENKGLSLPGLLILIPVLLFFVVVRGLVIGLKLNNLSNDGDNMVAYFILLLAIVSNAVFACTLPSLMSDFLPSRVSGFPGLLTDIPGRGMILLYASASSAIIITLPIIILIGFGSAWKWIFLLIINTATIAVISMVMTTEWTTLMTEWLAIISTPTEWLTIISTGPFKPDLIYGFVCACSIAIFFKSIAKNPQIPSPALAAFLVFLAGLISWGHLLLGFVIVGATILFYFLMFLVALPLAMYMYRAAHNR